MKPAPGTPTPFPRLNLVLNELVSGVKSILGESLVSACLQGSFAIGDFDAFSDVDFVMITETEPEEGEVVALQKLHGSLFLNPSPWARHLEGSYFPVEILGDIKRRKELLWYLDNGSNIMIKSTHCNSVVVRWALARYGVVLAGRHPAELVGSIPRSALKEEIRATMRDWAEEIANDRETYYNRFYQGFIVLSYCRMLRDLSVGDTGSKQAGARWFKTRHPGRWDGLIDRAWATRPCPEWQIRQIPDPQDYELTMAFLSHCLELAARIT
jgi:predicted nucleotidyltransferase